MSLLNGLYFLFPLIFIAAYKHADGKKIDGKRVLVDVERARTVKGWLPRRLGKHRNSNPFNSIRTENLIQMFFLIASQVVVWVAHDAAVPM